MNKKIITIIALFIIIFGLATYLYSSNTHVTPLTQGPNITSSDRVLIVAPHPDDETIACGGIIRYCVKNNIPVSVVVVTNGGKGHMGVVRHQESINATMTLGLPPENITFLDYPQALQYLFNDNWNHPWEEDGNSTQNVFAYQKNALNTGDNLEKNLESTIKDFNPTIIIYPYPNDANPDHWGTSSFVEYATNNLNYTGKKYSYPVHVASQWPFPRSYFPQINLLPPSFLKNQINWLVFPINDSDEKIKYKAINSYKSQLNGDPTFLLSYVRKNELFIPYEQSTVQKKTVSIDYINNNQFPPTLFKDPVGDTLVKPPLDTFYSTISNLNLMDLTDIGFDEDNNTIWMSLKTVGGPSKIGIYNFHIRSFGSSGVNRIDVKVQNGTGNYVMLASNSLKSDSLKVKVNDNGIIIGIPSNLLNDQKYMLSVDDMRNNQFLDRTGWYTVNIIS